MTQTVSGFVIYNLTGVTIYTFKQRLPQSWKKVDWMCDDKNYCRFDNETKKNSLK